MNSKWMGAGLSGALTLACAASAAAQEPFWAREQNQRAAQAVLSGSRAAAAATGVAALSSRSDAVDELRARLGASSAPAGGPGMAALAAGPVNVVTASFSGEGRVDGLWAYRQGGLRARSAGGSDETVRQFILENMGVYDLQGSDAAAPADLDWLGEPVRTVSRATAGGRASERLVYNPTYRGYRILDGTVIASFHGDDLISLTGTVVNPAMDLAPVGPQVGEAAARRNALARLAAVHGVPFSVLSSESGLVLASQKLVYRFLAQPARLARRLPEPVVPQTVMVDALDGRVISIDGAVPHVERQSQYRVYRPNSSDSTPNQKRTSDRTFNADTQGNNVFPWDLTGNSRVVTFSIANVSNGQFATFTQPTSSPNFLSNAGTARFRLQHAAYWAGRSGAVGEAMFSRTAPASGFENTRVRVLQGVTTGRSNFWNIGTTTNCENTTPDTYDSDWCVRIANDWVYDNNTPHIALVAHEMGHYIDQKYTGSARRYDNGTTGANGVCDPGTSEEAQSVAEGIAMIFSQAVFMNEFNRTTSFTDYDASSGSLNWLSPGGPNVHTNDGNIQCYANPAGAACTDQYNFANALQQAFWESAHGRNCGGDAPNNCVDLNDGSSHADARNALGYAMANTPAGGTHVQLTANFLAWYWNNIGEGVWSNRWWIFNHHRLVGPNYGYSPCHLF